MRAFPCASTARADRRSARGPRAPRTRARRGSAARVAVLPARHSLSPSLRERVPERRTHPRSECLRRLAGRPTTARARRRAARCHSASDLRWLASAQARHRVRSRGRSRGGPIHRVLRRARASSSPAGAPTRSACPRGMSASTDSRAALAAEARAAEAPDGAETRAFRAEAARTRRPRRRRARCSRPPRSGDETRLAACRSRCR